jgi:hypothetical protein
MLASTHQQHHHFNPTATTTSSSITNDCSKLGVNAANVPTNGTSAPSTKLIFNYQNTANFFNNNNNYDLPEYPSTFGASANGKTLKKF